MYLSFRNRKITGILSVVPQNTARFEDEVGNYAFPPEQTLALKKMMGYNVHRICKSGNACISDLVKFGFNYLFENGLLAPADVDAFILLSNSPDYPVPPTSNILQGELGFKEDCICLDVNQGCAGFMVGLMQAFVLLEQEDVKKVAVVTADIESRTHSFRDRASFPLMGDAATITIVERGESAPIHQFIKKNGNGAKSIMMPAGGLKCPASEETLRWTDDGNGNVMTGHHIRMEGGEIFNFVMKVVPKMFFDVFEKYGLGFDDVDFLMVHQPNKFLLSRLAKKLGVTLEKMPANVVENLGNSAGSTIPNDITLNIGTALENRAYRLCLAAFGEGLIWSATILDVGPLPFCRLIEADI